MRLKRFTAGLALALAVTAAVTQAPLVATSIAARDASVESLVQSYAATDKVPGIVVSVGRGDKPAEFYSAGRVAVAPDATAAGPDSLWRVYSMTKPITGIAAMILVEEGKLGLDQPISDFIPAFKDMKVLDEMDGTTLASHPAKTPITVRHLLTHTAGLGYNIITKGALLDEYNRLGINPAQVSTSTETNFRKTRPASLEAFADAVASLPLVAEPGTKWSYSIGLDVLGRVIEVASGMPFDQFLQTRIFDPLKMKSTFFTVPQSEVGRFADNYLYMGDIRVPMDTAAGSVWLSPPAFPYGGAGLVSSAYDYDRFLHMLSNLGELDGLRILKPETAKLAMSNLLPANADTSILNTAFSTSAVLGFGAGGSVYLQDAPTGVKKGTYGWGGAAGTIAMVDPVAKLRVVAMVNYFPSEHWPLRADLTKAIFGARP